MKKQLKYSSLILLLLVLIVSCAKVVAPTGGEKDTSPPEIVKSSPENFSVNFTDKKIIITFDEYIQLKNVNQELLTSPPHNEKPEIKLRGKSLVINIKDTLEQDVTYNLNFNNAIADNNESNILKNYQYIFSTGNIIDTLFIVGHLYNAFNLDFEEETFVMLYKNYNDSTPYKKIPDYVAKTDEEGAFFLNNLCSGSYRIFALKDANSNYLFDQPSEAIAFLDTLLVPKVEIIEVFDTVKVKVPEDTVFVDSVVKSEKLISSLEDIHLFLFQEDYQKQYLVSSSREKKGNCTFIFNKPLDKELIVNPVNFTIPESEEWKIIEKSITNDTINYWITDSLIYKTDTLIFEIKYNKKDSIGNYILTADTINLIFTEKEKIKSKKGKKDKEEKITKVPSELSLSFNIKNQGNLDLNKNLQLIFNYPISDYDTSLINLYFIEDTIETLIKYDVFPDTVNFRKFSLSFPYEEASRYKLIVDSNAFKDIYNNINDSLALIFTTRSIEDYGIILLSIENCPSPSYLLLLDEKENILRKIAFSNKTEIKYLLPKKYVLKIIHDKNNNDKWDTGNYLKNIQPEKVYYYEQEIIIKENWDIEIIWDVEE
ncbi:MAG: Ig-like domain-containing protein [Bacteroidales bacterium]|nr:Ig-like domain-containing protein [Bacteroidales bacterium]